MRASVFPLSLSAISRKRTNATDTIGTTTMRTKKSVSRLRNVIGRPEGSRAKGGPVHAPDHRGRTSLATLMGPHGAIAQLGERLDRTQEVGGSSPPSST